MPPSSNGSIVSHSSTVTTRFVMNDKLAALLNQPENRRCADCSDLRPSWASLMKPPAGAPPESPTIGLFCCLFCSAAHRLLGDSICTVKSVKLDQWEDEEVLAMAKGGNLRVNAIFEGALFDDTKKPTPLVDAAVREQYVQEKYVNLKYFVVKAYSCVGTESEDEDDDIIDDEQSATVDTVSAFSQSTTFTKHTLPSIAETPSRLATVIMTPQIARPSLGRFPRQSSMPDMKCSVGAGLNTPVASKVSEALALKKIASPFRASNDFWESMNNSEWGDLTFDDSLHRKSGVDLANSIRRSSWNLAEDERLPSCPEQDTKELKQKNGRRRGMPKKARSERIVSTSKDLSPRTPATSKAKNKKKLDRDALMLRQKSASDRGLLSTRTKLVRNYSLESPKRPSRSKPGRNLSLGSPRRTVRNDSPSLSPSKTIDQNILSVLDLLEEKNRDRKKLGKPSRQRSEPCQQIKVQCLPRQNSAPSTGLEKSQSLRDVCQHVQNGHPSRISNHEGLTEPTRVTATGKSRSLSPKSQRQSRSTNSRNRTFLHNDRSRQREPSEDSPFLSGRSLSLTRVSRHVDMRRQQVLQRQANRNDSAGFSRSRGSEPSPRRSSSANAVKVMNKRHVGIGGSEDPPPAPNKGTPCTPGKRKTLKSRTPKTPLARKSSTMELSENDRVSSKLERSLSSKSPQPSRPRSLSVGRKNRLRSKNKGDNLSATTEHNFDGVFQHPLFAYPDSAAIR